MSNIKLIKGDCLEQMDKLIEKGIQVDLIVTDPPYKLNKTTGSMTSSSKQNSWSGNLKAGDKTANISNNIKFSEWLPIVYRLLKPQSHFYVFVNDKNVQDMLNEATKVGFKLHNILVWHKNNKTPNRWYMKDCEFILFFHKGKSFPIENLSDSQYLDIDYSKEKLIWLETILNISNINGKNKIHPTQKPVELLNKIILNSSKENDLILDPFMGSCSCGESCINTNRNFIGIEKDDKYFDISVNRVNTYIKDNNLENIEVEIIK